MNRLVLTGMAMAVIGHTALVEKLAAWVITTGTRNVSSGVIRCDAGPAMDVMIYSCHYDSAHWTGRGFKGFSHKHPGEPQVSHPSMYDQYK